MANSTNGYTNKELLNMVMDQLKEIDKKLEAKLDKAEFYKVLGLLIAVGGLVVAALMQENNESPS